jgi:tRNA(fMet)-specific endonuclease VapC
VARYLLDSGLIIRHLRGQRQTVQLLRGLGKMGRLSISAITQLEVHAGMAAEEQYATQKLLSRFVTYDLGGEIADRAGDLIAEKRGQSITLCVPDAIIAATAIVHNLTLVTLNKAHFEAIADLSLYPLAEDNQTRGC